MSTDILFSTKMDVRISDINHGDHLDYARLIQLIGNARALMFKENGLEDIGDDQKGIIMRELEIKYKGQAFFSDQLTFDLYIAESTTRYVKIKTVVYNSQTQAAVADCTFKLVYFDYDSGKPCESPDNFTVIFNK